MITVDMAVGTPGGGVARTLCRLYLARLGFAVVWAGLLLLTEARFDLFGVVLIVVYPLVDAAASAVIARASRGGKSAYGPYVNVAICLLAAIALAVAGTFGVPAVLLVWSAWAVIAGLTQVVVGIARRTTGDQRPVIFSGAFSVLAGASFALGASVPDASLSILAGYAVFGDVFFLLSAVWLRLALKEQARAAEMK